MIHSLRVSNVGLLFESCASLQGRNDDVFLTATGGEVEKKKNM